MPLYDYKCSSCGLVREHRQKFTDEALTECPECGGEYKRIITSVGVIFKGSGFHVNDYRPGTSSSKEVKKDSPDKTGGDDSSSKKPPSESSSSSDSKGESKPASGGSSPDSPQGNKVA